jgi:hypothetical protein
MSAFKRLPMDIVKHILPYDRRFVLRNGEIIQINKLDMNKYKTAALNLLLIKKPKIKHSTTCCRGTGYWDTYSVKFSNHCGICYSLGYMGKKDDLVYSYGYNTAFTYVPHHKITIL